MVEESDTNQLTLDPAHSPPREASSGTSHNAPHSVSRRTSKARRPKRGPNAMTARGERRPLWRRLRRLACFLVLIGVVELVAAALTTKHFAVKAVDLSGVEITPESKLQEIAGRLVGQNWIRARLGEAEKAAQALPTVKSARVVRVLDEWPPRLTMRIEERQPFTRVGGGKTWWIVDREGILFRKAKEADKGLSAVTASVLDLDALQPGHKLPTKLWASVVELTDALQNDSASGAQWSLRRTYIDKWGFASLRLTGGAHDEMLVRLGSGRWPEKLQRTRQALAYFDASGKRASALNLVSFNMPTWTPRVQPSSNSQDSEASENSAQSDATTTSVTPSSEPNLATDAISTADGTAEQPT